MAKAQPFRLEATYAPVSERGCSRSDLNRVHQPRNLRIRTTSAMAKAPAITLVATYTPVSNRAGSRSEYFILTFYLIIV